MFYTNKTQNYKITLVIKLKLYLRQSIGINVLQSLLIKDLLNYSNKNIKIVL